MESSSSRSPKELWHAAKDTGLCVSNEWNNGLHMTEATACREGVNLRTILALTAILGFPPPDNKNIASNTLVLPALLRPVKRFTRPK